MELSAVERYTTERVDPGIVDQDIDLAVAELDCSSRHVARARRVAQVRRKKIRFASCGTDVCNRLLPALRIAADDDDMHAHLPGFCAMKGGIHWGSKCGKV